MFLSGLLLHCASMAFLFDEFFVSLTVGLVRTLCFFTCLSILSIYTFWIVRFSECVF